MNEETRTAQTKEIQPREKDEVLKAVERTEPVSQPPLLGKIKLLRQLKDESSELSLTMATENLSAEVAKEESDEGDESAQETSPASNDAVGATTFHNFSGFARELRLAIWEEAAMIPRFIEVAGYRNGEFENSDDMQVTLGDPRENGVLLSLVTKASPSALFRVSKESRSVAKTVFSLSLEVNVGIPSFLPFNPAQDTVLFTHTGYQSCVSGTSLILTGAFLSTEVQSKIQYLAIGIGEQLSLICDNPVSFDDIPGILKFTALKELTIILHHPGCDDSFEREGELVLQDIPDEVIFGTDGTYADAYEHFIGRFKQIQAYHPSWAQPKLKMKASTRNGMICCNRGPPTRLEKRLKKKRAVVHKNEFRIAWLQKNLDDLERSTNYQYSRLELEQYAGGKWEQAIVKGKVKIKRLEDQFAICDITEYIEPL